MPATLAAAGVKDSFPLSLFVRLFGEDAVTPRC
jgi:hypothetical protein